MSARFLNKALFVQKRMCTYFEDIQVSRQHLKTVESVIITMKSFQDLQPINNKRVVLADETELNFHLSHNLQHGIVLPPEANEFGLRVRFAGLT
jgi:hypothetical protein